MPALRRAALIAPLFRKIKGMLPRVSATEQEALERRHHRLRRRAVLRPARLGQAARRPADHADGGGEGLPRRADHELCRMVNDWQIRHNDKEIPEEVWDFVKKHGFLGMLISKEHGGPRLLAAGAVADPGQDRLALARRRAPSSWCRTRWAPAS